MPTKIRDGAPGAPGTTGPGTGTSVTGTNPTPGSANGAVSEGRGGPLGPRGDADIFKFTVEAGAVTGASAQTPAGTTVTLPKPEGLSYSLSGSDVIATFVRGNSTMTQTYSDTDGDGFFQVVSSTRVLTAAPAAEAGPGGARTVTVTLNADGSDVLEVSRVGRDGAEVTMYPSTETPANPSVTVDWSVAQGLVVQTVTGPSGTAHYEIYRDGNADGVYTQVASGTGTMPALVGVIAATDAFASGL